MKGSIYLTKAFITFERGREKFDLWVEFVGVGFDEQDVIDRYTKDVEPGLWAFRKKKPNKTLRVIKTKRVEIITFLSKTIHDIV